MRESERDGFLRRREYRSFVVAEERRRRREHRGVADSDRTRHGFSLVSNTLEKTRVRRLMICVSLFFFSICLGR